MKLNQMGIDKDDRQYIKDNRKPMEGKMIHQKLSRAWGISDDDVDRALCRLDAKKWTGREGLEAIVYAGTINNDHSDKACGHNGYWIADDNQRVCYVTNGDPVWDDWSETVADEIGLLWDDYCGVMDEYKI